MNADFASAVKETLKHRKCAGLTFWPTAEGRFMVSIAWESRSTWIVQVDANPMAALYKAMLEFERRANNEKVDTQSDGPRLL